MAAPSNPNRTQLDQTQILQRAFDEAADRLRVDAAVSINTGTLDIVLSHVDDSVRLGDGTNFLTSTSGSGKVALDVNLVNNSLQVDISHLSDSIKLGDGSNLVTTTNVTGKQGLDVNIINPVSATLPPNTSLSSYPLEKGLTKNTYNEATSVASGILTTLTTYTVPGGSVAYFTRSEYSGTNIATFDVRINGIVQDKKRTNYAVSLNDSSIFNSSGNTGIPLVAGDIVTTTVIHDRPNVGDFNARIEVIEVLI